MSDTLAALEAALRRSPADPALLDAVTDYFLDRDDPRGQYLQLSRRLEAEDSLLPELDRHRLRYRITSLMGRHRDEWLGPLRSMGDRVTVHDFYFIWPFAVTARDIGPDMLATLAVSPLLSRVDFVAPGDDRPGDAGVQRLLASGLVGRIVELILTNFGVTDDGAERLAADPAVHRLELLRLPLNHVSVIGREALRAVGHWDIGPQILGPLRHLDGGYDV